MRIRHQVETVVLAAPPGRLRIRLSYPRVGRNVLPSNARPFLFGCD